LAEDKVGAYLVIMFMCASGCFCVTYSEVMTIYQLLFMNFSPFNKRLKEKGKKQRIEGRTMAQWINILRYNSFVNGQQLPLLCEKTGAIALVILGLMAGWCAGRWVGRRNSA